MRPLYENERHRQVETALIEALQERWSVVGKKLPISYGLDFALTRDKKTIAWLEIKGKPKHTFEEMVKMLGGVPLDLDKMERALNYQKLTNKPFALVCAFRDGIYHRKFDDIAGECPFECRFGGRDDRGDWQDQEPYLVLDPEKFAFLCVNEWTETQEPA